MNFKIFFICQEQSNSYKDALNLFDLLPDEIKNSLEKVELIDTLNVVDLAHNSLQNITPISKEQSISFSTNPQLIGLCQTHINIWRKVAEQELDFCFVIEENVNFSDFLTLLLSNPDIPEKLDFVNFTSTDFLSSACYYISNRGAKKLISIHEDPKLLNWDIFYENNFTKNSIKCGHLKFIEYCTLEKVGFHYRINFINKDLIRYHPKNYKKIEDNFEFWKKDLSITSCICTYGNYESCRETLLSLIQQTISDDKNKIFIIDNFPINQIDGERSEHFKKLKSLCDLYDHCEYIHTPTSGLSESRNIAIDKCTTDLIFYTDDDAIANFDILENFKSKFLKFQNLAVCGGKVAPKWISERPDWLNDNLLKFLSIQNSDSKNVILTEESEEYIVGTNMCFRTSILKKSEGFNAALGRRGKILMSGEEDELLSRLKQNYICVYSSDCLVYHKIFPERLEENWFIKRCAWQLISNKFVLGQQHSYPEELEIFLNQNKDKLFEKNLDSKSFSEKLSYIQLLLEYLL